MNAEHPHEPVRAAVDVVEVHDMVHSSEEGAIQPSTALGYKLGDLSNKDSRGAVSKKHRRAWVRSYLIRHIREGMSTFHIAQCPRPASL